MTLTSPTAIRALDTSVRHQLLGPAGFVLAHILREAALVYQRYVFFGTLGASAFGLASVAVAPALFATVFLTMISGELVIGLRARRLHGCDIADALKYIVAFETVGVLLTIAILLLGAEADLIAPALRAPVRLSALVVLAAAFSQISLNWALLDDRRGLYAAAFYAEAAIVLATSRWLVEWLGLSAVVIAYCVRPLTLTVCIVAGLGWRRVWARLHEVLRVGSVSVGRAVHRQAGHQVGGLAIKSAWSTLDVLMVAALAGERGAGHYRILKTLASLPGVAISPVWAWLRPDIARACRDENYRPLVGRIVQVSLIASVPAVLLVLVPSFAFDAVYRWMFPNDELPGGVLKVSLIMWWLVASTAGWARSVSVATGRLDASTYGNLLVFILTFAVGPALVLAMGFNPLYVVPAALLVASGYWMFFLIRLCGGRLSSPGRDIPARPAPPL